MSIKVFSSDACQMLNKKKKLKKTKQQKKTIQIRLMFRLTETESCRTGK